jgi:hypothetical protein
MQNLPLSWWQQHRNHKRQGKNPGKIRKISPKCRYEKDESENQTKKGNGKDNQINPTQSHPQRFWEP